MSPTRPAPNNLVSSPRLAGIRVPELVVLMVCMISSPELPVVRASADGPICPAGLRNVWPRCRAGRSRPSPGLDELRKAVVATTDRARRDGERGAVLAAAAGQRVRIVVETVEGGAVQPGVLDEFELPGQVADQADEVQPRPAALGRAVAARPSQQPVQVA